jgi:hypothetical protein
MRTRRGSQNRHRAVEATMNSIIDLKHGFFHVGKGREGGLKLDAQ